jgi:hypothetical protein
MGERVELNSEIRIASGVQGIKTSREPVSEEARKNFAQELERKLSHEKKKDKKGKKDEIILHQDENQDEEEKPKDEHKPSNNDGNRGGLLDIKA